jgi:hypothetical protein
MKRCCQDLEKRRINPAWRWFGDAPRIERSPGARKTSAEKVGMLSLGST